MGEPAPPADRVSLRADPSRVVLRPFVPAENGAPSRHDRPRVGRILDRVLALDPGELESELGRVLANLRPRHRAAEQVLARRYADLVERHARGRAISSSQRLIAGAYLTEEYAFEAAALFNPSVVAHPDQSGVEPGALRLILSLRAVGEGLVSSITFRTAQLGPDATLRVDPPSPSTVSPRIDIMPGGLPDDCGVRISFQGHDDLSQLVLFPVTYPQRHGIEDLRLTRFVEDGGEVSYLGTYTAFSGETVRQELLRTRDFATFELDALRGDLAATKGMALFPRRIGGRYAMLGRHDHENIWFLASDDLHRWDSGKAILAPRWPWEFVQVGVCSPPIELDEGWLVVTHGVGPIRSYCLGCCLLDKRDPAKVLARSREPLLYPGMAAQAGYVPNVTYSCGAIAHGATLLLPYGVADTFTAFAALPLDAVLRAMA